MASATEMNLASSTDPSTSSPPPSPPSTLHDDHPTTGLTIAGLGSTEWARLIGDELQNLAEGKSLNPKCLSAPRRRHADPAGETMAFEIASQLYPSFSDSPLRQVIKYEKDIPPLRKAILTQEKAKEEARLHDRLHPPFKERVKAQGPWDRLKDPLSLKGTPALPMPVEISDEESLAPFFAHIGGGGTFHTDSAESGEEDYYAVGVKIWEKGMLYEDGRMDLCKKVLGPPNISNLMAHLEKNTFIRHFLLGNNMIGPVGARMIADFVQKYPDNIQTWYLAGNCIDLAGLERLVPAWSQSQAITNIWLKRNPLGPEAHGALGRLITQTPNLRTLDLDQTELSDEGVAQLFYFLASQKQGALPLRNIYLNAVGISTSACKAVAEFLALPDCRLESLYMSCNPVGDQAAKMLAQGLWANRSLHRLSMSSCGLGPTGANDIINALSPHPRLMTLIMGQSYATADLGARYNWLDDTVVPSAKSLITDSKTLKMLDLGTTAMSVFALANLAKSVAESKTLVFFKAKSVYGTILQESTTSVKKQIRANVHNVYDTSVEEFLAGDKRWLISPKDVRMIDSGYRNRDSGLARRGLLQLKKQWEDGMETVDSVMRADDARLEA